MKTLVASVLFVVTLHVPCCLTMAVGNLPLYDLLREAEAGESLMDGMSKRSSSEVDAWSICPSHMTEVDCFYAYLRVYARLRKAAEKSDRVSMRNIGKRSFSVQPGLDDGLNGLTGTGSMSDPNDASTSSVTGSHSITETGSNGFTGSGAIRRLLELCPDDMTPAMCYEAARKVYRRVLASLNNARLK